MLQNNFFVLIRTLKRNSNIWMVAIMIYSVLPIVMQKTSTTIKIYAERSGSFWHSISILWVVFSTLVLQRPLR